MDGTDTLPARMPARAGRTPDADGLPPGARLLAMLAVGIAVCLSVLDCSIANIALPTIAQDMHTTPAESIWVVNAYQLAVTISLLPFASLGRRVRPPAGVLLGPGPVLARHARLRPGAEHGDCWCWPACCRVSAAPAS